MMRWCVVAGVCGAALVLADGDAAAQEFDNPTMNGAPCVYLNRFEVAAAPEAGDDELYGGSAVIENVCGRALEVQFCFEYAPNEAGVESTCYDSMLRPWARTEVVHAAAAARITKPSYEWRYAPW